MDDYIDALGATALGRLIALVLSIAAAVAALSWFSVDERQAIITGALIFVALQSYALYKAVAKAGQQIHALATSGGACRILVGPNHAKLVQADHHWEADGVVWMAVYCDRGASLTITMMTPSGVTVRWKHREVTPHIWKFVGTNSQGQSTWTVRVPQTVDPLTSLGQFAVQADDYQDNREILVRADGETPAGLAMSHKVEIGLLADVRDDEPLIALRTRDT